MSMLLKNFATQPENMADTLPQSLAEDYTSLIGFVTSRHVRAKFARQQFQEQIWLSAYRAWRGENSPETSAALAAARARNGAASGATIKVTKTKATAAFGQICEILFANNKFPLAVEPTPCPEGIEETVTIVPQGIEYQGNVTDTYGWEGDGREVPAGATKKSLIEQMSGKLKSLIKNQTVVPGASPDSKSMPEAHPAQDAATKLEKVMQDQLEEGKGEQILRKTAFEAVLYGTGVTKGPFSVNEITPDWVVEDDDTVTYSPKLSLEPRFEHVSVWDFYPDPDAERIEECEYVIERHLMSRTQLKQLANRPKFNAEAINMLMSTAPHHSMEDWESTIGLNTTGLGDNRFEVLEYWGTVDKDLLLSAGVIDIKDEDLNTLQANIWVCNGYILRVVINPFLPNYLPYHVVPYEEHPHRLWGIGVPENMADTQSLMDGHLRMAIDNLRLAGHCVFEVNETYLAPGQNFDIFPGKVFRMQGGVPGQAVHSIKFENTSGSHLQFFDKAMQLADTATGIPSYSHGGTQGNASLTRNSSAMSMLMSAAALSTKTVAKNFDAYIQSLGEALFRWNMQFNVTDKGIRGDVKIVAKGTASLMQREVVTQRLLSLLQIGASPIVAPFLKVDEIIKEIVRNMDLNGERFVNDPATAMLFAQTIGATGGMVGQGTPAGPQGEGQVASPQAATMQQPPTTDGANISGGAAPPAAGVQ